MSLARCTACQRRDGRKPITCFIAWHTGAHERLCVRTQLCVTCFAMKISPLDFDPDKAERLTCPNCGIDTDADYDAVFINTFIPGYGRRDFEAPFCGACAAHFRIWAQSSGTPMEDRGRADIGPASMISASETLRSLGLRDA